MVAPTPPLPLFSSPTPIPLLSLLHKLTGHKDSISSIVFSPDSTLLASGSNDKTVRLWQVSDGTLARRLVGFLYEPFGIAFSQDGKLLAGGQIGRAYLWSAPDGKLLRTMTIPYQPPTPVPFSPSGPTPAPPPPPPGPVQSVTFSSDGSLLATAASQGDKSIQLWRVSDGRLMRTLRGHTDSVQSVAFSPDGSLLASGAKDKSMRVWRVSDGKLLHTLTGHIEAVGKVLFSPDGTLLASAAEDNTVRLWRISDGTEVHALAGLRGQTLGMIFSLDGASLYTGHWYWEQPRQQNVVIRQWRISDEKELTASIGQMEELTQPAPILQLPYSVLAFSSDGSLVCAGLGDAIYLWRMR
ncbi:MAG: WD40 repeat domain-containing protein [Chloroflexota bacterium]|nr:WD40 repeat domain-containing protein [Chloroflexota bacterium]